MLLSAKSYYAFKAVLCLSCHWPSEEPLKIQDIAKREKIPMKFLTQILLVLKQSGCVESIRGKSGGYLLAKEPKDITFLEITKSFGECNFNPNKNVLSDQHVLHEIFLNLNSEIDKYLGTINFQKLRDMHNNKEKVVMFEI